VELMTDGAHFRTCPLCDATCGLEISVSDGVITRIRGDRDDVFSRGFICPKGSTLKHLHEDPDRLRAPQLRAPTGHHDATWDDAFAEIDRRLMPIIAEHGSNAVGVYLGNPNAHNLSGLFWVRPFLRALGSRNIFSASTVDQMPRHVSSGLMFGDPYAIVVPDLDRTAYLLILGANPYESNGSLATAPDWPGRLKGIQQRGGRVVVVDPRRTRTAAAADEHLFIRPGTDALLLCALISVIVSEGLVDVGDAAPHLNGLDDAVAAVSHLTPDAVSGRTGIAAETIRRIARELAGADSAAVYGRVGVHTVVGGTVASWATDVLNTVTGNLDRPGGAMWSLPAHARPTPPGGGGRGYRIGRWASRVSQRPEANGELPVGILAEEIETDGPDRIRALITIGGNPVLSTPHSDRLDAALSHLEFMASVDIYINETTRHADVILPAPSPLQKSHYDAGYYGHAVRRVANFSPPLFSSTEPSEGDVLGRLIMLVRGHGPDGDSAVIDEELVTGVLVHAVADPHSVVFGRDPAELRSLVHGSTAADRIVDALVRTGPFGDGFGVDAEGLTLQRMLDHQHGIDFGPLEPRLPQVLQTPSGKVELAPPEILDAIPAVLATDAQPDELVMIGRRDLRSNNSWMHNVPVLMKGKQRCTLLIHPLDAAARDLKSGDVAMIRSPTGRVDAPIEITDDVMPGVVCLPHGWGHDAEGSRLSVAGATPGVNMNRLVDGTVLEPLSGNARLNGVPVRVDALRAATP
jgi:anaerobic selenocysteine-containing dehydrogenase